MARVLLILVALMIGAAACGGDPDGNSGGDAYRSEAQPIPLGDWVAGDLDVDNGDRTDWKAVDLENSGKLNVEINADDKSAAVEIYVYDRYGYSLGSVARPKGAGGPVKVTVKAKRDGRYFIMIQQKSGNATAYSVRATVGESSDVPTPDF